MHDKKLKIFLILLGTVILCILAVVWLTTVGHNRFIRGFNLASISRFEKCNKNVFCGFTSFNQLKVRILIDDENGEIIYIERYNPPASKPSRKWIVKLSPSQRVVSKRIPPFLGVCHYGMDGNFTQITFSDNVIKKDTTSLEPKCKEENPNANPDVLKVLQFFNSKEGKRMLNDDH